MKISIEDFCEDIVGKAMRGLGLSDDAVSKATGTPVAAILAVRRGNGDEATVRAIAGTLGLDPDKLAASLLNEWYPEEHAVNGLFMSNTPYEDMRVNAYLVWDPASHEGAIFDTGSSAQGIVEHANAQDIRVSRVFLTHTHNDHIMDLEALRAAFPKATVHVGRREPVPDAELLDHGDHFSIGAIKIITRLTWGHSKGGLTYVIDGLAKPVAVVGDAVFAGSMGGGMISYQDALRTNRDEILTLPDETIICPGHGPLTSVAEEKAHNPFF